MADELKQVILVNGWLDMPTGKLAAQVSHASMAFLTSGLKKAYEGNESFQESMRDVFGYEILDNWLFNKSFAKLVLVIRSESEWSQIKSRLQQNDMNKGVDYFEIIDQGRTVFDGIPTHTCTGFKPLNQREINKFFGSLPLLK